MKHKRGLMSVALVTLMLVSLCAVYTSTSVSAAPSGSPDGTSSTSSSSSGVMQPVSTSIAPSRSVDRSSSSSANIKAGLAGAPAGIVGDPAAACSQPGTNGYDLFVRGTDNAVWWRHETSGTWGSWVSLGGSVTSSPAAASSRSNELYVAARGTNGQLYRTYTLDGGINWSGWVSRGGNMLAGTGPAILIETTGGFQYACIGTNHQLYWWHGTWSSLGGYLISSPSADRYYGIDGHIHIAAQGRDGAVWRTYTTDSGTTWGTWLSYGGKLLPGQGPAVVYDGYYIRYLVTGTNHQLYYWHDTVWDPSLGGYLTSAPAAASQRTGFIDVFAIGGDSAIWSRWTQNSGSGATWNPWYKIAG